MGVSSIPHMGIPSEGKSEPVALAISGMHCGNCVARVAKALTAVEGVEVDSLSIGSAVVRVDENRATVNDVVAAVARAGYVATTSAA